LAVFCSTCKFLIRERFLDLKQFFEFCRITGRELFESEDDEEAILKLNRRADTRCLYRELEFLVPQSKGKGNKLLLIVLRTALGYELILDLLQRMLEPDPDKRICVQEALEHEYFQLECCPEISFDEEKGLCVDSYEM
jgi:serine/threonine protein kinase